MAARRADRRSRIDHSAGLAQRSDDAWDLRGAGRSPAAALRGSASCSLVGAACQRMARNQSHPDPHPRVRDSAVRARIRRSSESVVRRISRLSARSVRDVVGGLSAAPVCDRARRRRRRMARVASVSRLRGRGASLARFARAAPLAVRRHHPVRDDSLELSASSSEHFIVRFLRRRHGQQSRREFSLHGVVRRVRAQERGAFERDVWRIARRRDDPAGAHDHGRARGGFRVR